MIGKEQFERLWRNLRGLGPRRLIALGLTGLAVVATVALGAYQLGRPEREPLYANLSREDVARIGGALKDAGIAFDVNADGTTVLVAHADTAKARMLLAVKGLPQSANTGYELFNDVRAFGLTSFMQEVTRVRALEGELARTIQTMNGIKAARVHIVLPDRTSFRRERQQASASVVIRTENAQDDSSAQAIRRLVGAAVPGLKPGDVTVLNTEGAVLTATDDENSAATGRKAALQQQVSREVEEKIRRTLTPYLGIGNFEVSVTSRIDTDRVTTSETVYDPASKVERSVRVIKEVGQSQNRTKQPAATVQQNIPTAQANSDSGLDASENSSRREELTNFEVSTRTIETVRDAYVVRTLSIAVLVNKDRLAAPSGQGTEVIPVEQQLYEVEQLVGSAAGYDKERGDRLKVAAVAFADSGHALEPVPSLPWSELLLRQAGTMINALTLLAVAGLLVWFGLRPAVQAVLSRPQDETDVEVAGIEAAMHATRQIPAMGIAGAADVAMPGVTAGIGAATPHGAASAPERAGQADGNGIDLIEDLTSRQVRSPQKRLEQIVAFDEEQAAAILRQWLHQEIRT